MRTFSVEYLTTLGRLKSTRVTARNLDNAIDKAVEQTGIDFFQVQTVEPREKV